MAPEYPFYTPYQFAGNKPIRYIDLDGLEEGETKINFNFLRSVDETFTGSMVNMGNAPITKSTNFTALGWQRDKAYFWEVFRGTPLGKEALSKNNLYKINNLGLAPTVDDQWNSAMKKYGLDGRKGDRLHHHHHNKGPNTYPVPLEKHTKPGYDTVNHGMNKRKGTVYNRSGQGGTKMKSRLNGLKSGFGGVSLFFDVISIFSDGPHSPLRIFGGREGLNFDLPTQQYYELRYSDDEHKSYEIEYYESYEVIDGEFKGTNSLGTEYYYKDEAGKSHKSDMGYNISIDFEDVLLERVEIGHFPLNKYLGSDVLL